MKKYQKKIEGLIKDRCGLSEVVTEIPPDATMGDIALPCFSFAKQLKQNPQAIANKIKGELAYTGLIERMEVKGGYLNFFLNRSLLIQEVVEEIQALKNQYGSSLRGKGKKALVEHTSINPNASPHVGRARNAMIGDVLVRLLKFEGYTVDTHYFVNDIGKQIAMLVLGSKDQENIQFKDLLKIYIQINDEINKNPELEKEVFSLLHRLENEEEEVKKAFRKVVDICIEGQVELFTKLGIKYDTFTYESDYLWNNRLNELLEQYKKTRLLEEDEEGRWVLNQEAYQLPMKAPYLVLTRKDKTSLYPLRDIAYTIDKVNSNSEINMIVLGEDQILYFQQIQAALDLLGYKAPSPVHYSFVLLSEGKMATRKGNVVLLEDFMKEAYEKVVKNMKQRYEKADHQVAKSIAYGAVKYSFLKVSNDKNVTFDWGSALSFEGDTGPYLQYSNARIQSILKKYNEPLPEHVDYKLLNTSLEYELVKELSNLYEVVDKTLEENSPHIIANYLYSVAKNFSLFYHQCPVLSAQNEETKKARLVLIDAVSQVIRNCLWLLGIDEVETM